ncbi:hypothetical protein B0G77_7532 [Paraburkholderia sp. BL10I2N1]|nr:hypothetical protein B0G77_7532 [Paraburkholderia sp. BL10I2N1]
MVKKTRLLAVAGSVALAMGSVHAQSSVQLYGLMDLSVLSYQTNANAHGKHVISMGRGLAAAASA